jgi:hypothetical protein
MTCEIRGTFEITKGKAVFQRNAIVDVKPVGQSGIDIILHAIFRYLTVNLINIISIIEGNGILSSKPVFDSGLKNISVIRGPSNGSGNQRLPLYGSGRKIRFSNLIGANQIIPHPEREIGTKQIPGIETPVEARVVIVFLFGIKDESGIEI